MENASEILLNKIKTVLESDLTPYRIAKEVGLANATPVHKYIDGRSDIKNMSLAVAMEFEKLYEEMFNMINVKKTKILTNSGLRFFSLPQHRNDFAKHFKEDNIRELSVAIDEDFYKALFKHPVIVDADSVHYFVEGALEGIEPYKFRYLSTMNDIHKHEIVNKISDSETADYSISRSLLEPYRQ